MSKSSSSLPPSASVGAPSGAAPSASPATSPSPRRGRLIALEGVDGSGTTTQTRALVDALRSQGEPAISTCEPSSGPIGKLLRQCLQQRERLPWGALALLFAADRLDHVARELEGQLAAGVSVVTDRYLLSSLVYQSATRPGPLPSASAKAEGGRGAGGASSWHAQPSGASCGSEQPEPAPGEQELLENATMSWLREINRYALPPTVTVVLQVSPAVAWQRRQRRGGPAELFDATVLQARLATLYDRAEQLMPDQAVRLVSGEGSAEQVTARIVAALS